MEFRILGSMEVQDDARRVAVPSGRGRALLAILALHAGEPVGADRLIDELWGGDPPPTAATVVHGLVSKLRKVLEPGRGKEADPRILETVGAGYRLSIDPDFVDAKRFKRLVDEARDQAPAMRAEKLSTALALWRGPALADFTYEPFAQRTIAALEESRVEAIADRFDAELQAGRDAQLIAELQDSVATHPFRERLRGLLMIALYRAGRQAEALEAYRHVRATLVGELGLEPGPELRELEAAILRQDPSLGVRRELEQRPHPDTGSWLPRERRRVTVVVVDLAPASGDGLDPETAGDSAAHVARVASEVLERHGARVEASLGDELIALFGFPVAREDDALRAVRAALEARTALHPLEGPGSMRAGIETGDVVVAGPGAALRDVVMGPVVAAARRLAHIAGDDDVLVGSAAQRLLRGAAIVKQVDGAVAWRVLEVVIGASAIPRALDAPMIGREDELTRLRSAFRRALRSGSPVRVTVLGDAGIGKSRLAREVMASLGSDAHAIVLQCTPPGDGMGFHPVRQAVVEAAGVFGWRGLHALLETAADGESAVDEIGTAIALRSPPATAHDLVAPMRRLLETLASHHPLVVVVDNLHRSDSSFLELLDRLEREVTAGVLLLCLARADLFDAGKESIPGDAMRLESLSGSEVARLVIDRGGPIGQGALHRIVNLSQGNPLFAEQLLAAMQDGEVDTIPASLVGLLTMRLDRLGPGERNILRGASVAGLDFDVDVLRDLLPEEARPFVERHIDALERKRFIQRSGTGRFRFAHALIHMAAHQSMTREDRARLHAAFAGRPERERSGLTSELTGDGPQPAKHPTRPQSRGPVQTF